MREFFLLPFVVVGIAGIIWGATPSEDIADMDIVPQYARQQLLENGFAITQGHYNEFWDAYDKIEEERESPFITTDIVLHAGHLFFDNTLRKIEEKRLIAALDSLLDLMIEISGEQYSSAKNENIKNLAKLNIAFFATAKKLLNPHYTAPAEVRELVASEIKLIDAHEGPAPRPLLTYIKKPELKDYAVEDYSQYIPRGHYTRSEQLSRYFKAMMFLGRMDFKLQPGDSPEAVSDGKNMTTQALLMTEALFSNRDALRLWREIYEITSFFVGSADDLTPEDYHKLSVKIFGKRKKPDKFADEEKIEKFVAEAKKLRQPEIASNMVVIDRQDSRHGDISAATQGFRFMGQRFIPDSYILQKVVWGGDSALIYTGKGKPFTMEVIPNVGPARAFPRGLDVMAVLGFDAAYEILKKSGDTEYRNYEEIISSLRKNFSKLPESEWRKNLYWRYLDAIRTLAKIPAGKIPKFMRSALWRIKALITALGAWAELRHDTILYAKQSYTPMAKAMPPMPVQKERNPRGYVEPYPELYRKIDKTMAQLAKKLDSFGIDVSPIPEKIKQFREELKFLAAVSDSELAGKPLSEGTYNHLRYLGSGMRSIVDFERGIPNPEEKCDIIADVHTVQFKRQVLEEGIGAPFDIYVIVGEGEDARVCHGVIFSYYEFKWDMADRLTDEKWRKMRHRHSQFLPEWIRQVIAQP